MAQLENLDEWFENHIEDEMTPEEIVAYQKDYSNLELAQTLLRDSVLERLKDEAIDDNLFQCVSCGEYFTEYSDLNSEDVCPSCSKGGK